MGPARPKENEEIRYIALSHVICTVDQSFFYFFIRHSCEPKDAPDGEPKGDPGVSRDGQSSHESREAGLVVPDLWALEGQGIRNLQVYSSPTILPRSIALSHTDHLHPILGSCLKLKSFLLLL